MKIENGDYVTLIDSSKLDEESLIMLGNISKNPFLRSKGIPIIYKLSRTINDVSTIRRVFPKESTSRGELLKISGNYYPFGGLKLLYKSPENIIKLLKNINKND